MRTGGAFCDEKNKKGSNCLEPFSSITDLLLNFW